MSDSRRVVVVGHGMVGARFADDLHARDAEQRYAVTVLGAEEYEPYNRVLLSEVVAGRYDVASISLPRTVRARTTVLPGVSAARIDRSVRVVLDATGGRHPYDVLVLATGARARIPALDGFGADGGVPAGVHALRSLDDAREIVAATVNAQRAVVVGGGVLGLEVATGLARRGLAVTVVHGGRHLMDRQLDEPAAGVVAAGLAGQGIAVRVAARTEEALVRGGRIAGVRLEGGEVLPCELLVLTAGTVPETGLAVAAGLEVRRGVVVGHDLASPDDASVFAIGDCAEPPEGGTGLIAQGWDQARRLAVQLTDGPSAQPALLTGGSDVVRVKAAGLDVVTMGICGSRRQDSRAAAPSGSRTRTGAATWRSWSPTAGWSARPASVPEPSRPTSRPRTREGPPLPPTPPSCSSAPSRGCPPPRRRPPSCPTARPSAAATA